MRVSLGNDSLVKQENIVSARNQMERIALTFGVQFSIAFFVPFFRMSGYGGVRRFYATRDPMF